MMDSTSANYARTYYGERDIVFAIREYLQVLENLGKIIWWERLQAGDIIEARGETRRRVRLCRAGTPDFIVVSPEECDDGNIRPMVSFLEVKHKTKLTPDQQDFANKMADNGIKCYVIRSIEEVQAIWR